jgi:hypothetical protein
VVGHMIDNIVKLANAAATLGAGYRAMAGPLGI